MSASSRGATRATVLVTEGEQRASLAVVRSLGAAGHRVIVTAARARSLAGASRHACAQYAVPSALEDQQGYLEALEALVKRHAVDVLLPMTEQALLAVLDARHRFGDVVIPFPSAAQFRRISDKAFLLQTARDVGIAVPAQRMLASVADRAALASEALRFPLVLKPSRSVIEENGHRTKTGVRYAADCGELDRHLDAYPKGAYPIMLQQRIVGPGVGVFLLRWDGQIAAIFAHRRIREKPPAGGISVYRESIVADPELVEQSRRLLERFDWQGVAMVEYKIDASTGTAYAMEVNGRFWGSLQLAVDAGVDFPALLVARALGAAGEATTSYRPGIRSRWEWGDVDHLLARLRRSDEELALPPGAPGRLRTVLNVLTPWRPGDRPEILRLGDPGPFLRETIEWIQGR